MTNDEQPIEPGEDLALRAYAEAAGRNANLDGLRAALSVSDAPVCEACIDGLQADGETPCPCQVDDLPRQVRDLRIALANKDKELAEMRAERDAFEKSCDYWSSDAAEVCGQAATLMEALEPFAALADNIERAFTFPLEDDYSSPVYVARLGQLRAARAVIAAIRSSPTA